MVNEFERDDDEAMTSVTPAGSPTTWGTELGGSTAGSTGSMDTGGTSAGAGVASNAPTPPVDRAKKASGGRKRAAKAARKTGRKKTARKAASSRRGGARKRSAAKGRGRARSRAKGGKKR